MTTILSVFIVENGLAFGFSEANLASCYKSNYFVDNRKILIKYIKILIVSQKHLVENLNFDKSYILVKN